jgi:hypothetical protein
MIYFTVAFLGGIVGKYPKEEKQATYNLISNITVLEINLYSEH